MDLPWNEIPVAKHRHRGFFPVPMYRRRAIERPLRMIGISLTDLGMRYVKYDRALSPISPSQKVLRQPLAKCGWRIGGQANR
ncbi:hypothetical protein ES705_33320 [subsurface metagenome]